MKNLSFQLMEFDKTRVCFAEFLRNTLDTEIFNQLQSDWLISFDCEYTV